MKKKNPFVILLCCCTFIFAACTNEEKSSFDEMTTASLVLSNLSHTSTKADGDLVSATLAERTIKTCYIGCFDASGNLLQIIDFGSFSRTAEDGPTYSATNVTLKRDTRKIVVVANAPESLVGYTTYNLLKTALTSSASFAVDNLVKIGELDLSDAPAANQTYEIPLTQLVARVDVSVVVNNPDSKETVSSFIPKYTSAELASWYMSGELASKVPNAAAVKSGTSVTITVPGFTRTATVSSPSWAYSVTSSKVSNTNGKSNLFLSSATAAANSYDIPQAEQSFSYANSTFYTYEKKSGTSYPITFKVTGTLDYSITSKDSVVTSTAVFYWNTSSPSGDATSVTYNNPSSSVGTPSTSLKNSVTKTFGAEIKTGSTTSGLVHGYLYEVIGTITPVTAYDARIIWTVLDSEDIDQTITYE